MEAAFRRYATLLQAARAKPGQGSIALDGKTLRGSVEPRGSPDLDKVNDGVTAQVLSAFATDTALVLTHIDIAERSNEIPAAQALLAELGLAPDAVVTFDALHCQKTFEVAAQASIALIVGVKDNQPTLRQAVQEVSATTAPFGTAHSHDKSRNRDEHRTVAVLDPASTLANTDWQPHVAAIIRVERDIYARNAKTGLLRHSNETAFYVSNMPVAAACAAEAIRAHWRVENTSHHSRDVTLGEDRSRIRTTPGVFARLRSFAFNILKANRTDTLSQDRYRASLAGIGKLLRVLAVS